MWFSDFAGGAQAGRSDTLPPGEFAHRKTLDLQSGTTRMDFKTLKARMRGERLALRDAIPAVDRIEKSLHMADLAGDAIAFEPGEMISGFFPIRSEADMRPLMHRLKVRGARLCLPVVLDKETIVFRELVDGQPLVNTGFGTIGPGTDAAVVDPDLLLVPLSAFDDFGNRIGYGAGHYDRAIARLRAKGRTPRLLGVAFDCQRVDAVPAEPHDVPLNAVLTESGFHLIQKGM
jgi:5-formyltetrahydrofolate cyclo-ligase